MNINDNIERQIRDYFNGQLPASEEAELLHWLKSDEKNKAYFFSLKNNLEPQQMQHLLLQSSFSELKSKLMINREFESNSSGRIKSLHLSFLRIAAMIVMALITGFTAAYLILQTNQPKTEVVWFKTIVPRGEKSELILPDGSKVWVNSESNISYPSNFMEGNRQIKLNGEAYFEVEKLEDMTFTVSTIDYNIKVLGTKFNVMAYKEFGRTETSLVDGSIEIQKGNQQIKVEQGQTFTFTNSQFYLTKTEVSQTARWKDDIFDFDQITFKELIIRLERWYDVDIEIKNQKLNEIVYSGVFKNEETIWQVLNTLQLTLPIRYNRVDFRKFVIENK